jgi:hypothetical protein
MAGGCANERARMLTEKERYWEEDDKERTPSECLVRA